MSWNRGLVVGALALAAGPARAGTTNALGAEIAASVDFEDGCTSTSVTVFGQLGRLVGSDGRTTSTLSELEVVVEDTCNGTLLFAGFGVTEDVNFRITGRSAHLEDTLEMFDTVSGETVAVPVDVTWTGKGTPVAGADERCTFVDQGDQSRLIVVHGGIGYFEGTVSGTIGRDIDLSDGTLEFFEFGVSRDVFVEGLPSAVPEQECRTLGG